MMVSRAAPARGARGLPRERAFEIGVREDLANCFQSEAFIGLASSNILPVAMPCARKPIFSGKENWVGSRPSMKREKTFSMRSPL